MKIYDCALNRVPIDLHDKCVTVMGGSSCSNLVAPACISYSRDDWLPRHNPTVTTDCFMNAVDTARQEIDSLTSALLCHAPSVTILSLVFPDIMY